MAARKFLGQLHAPFSLCGESECVYESNGWSECVCLLLSWMSVQLSIYRVQFRPPLWLVKHTSLSHSQLLQLPILANCSSWHTCQLLQLPNTCFGMVSLWKAWLLFIFLSFWADLTPICGCPYVAHGSRDVATLNVMAANMTFLWTWFSIWRVEGSRFIQLGLHLDML